MTIMFSPLTTFENWRHDWRGVDEDLLVSLLDFSQNVKHRHRTQHLSGVGKQSTAAEQIELSWRSDRIEPISVVRFWSGENVCSTRQTWR